MNQHAWAVVLAGGDGTRLRPFIREISGEDRPKQFCTLYGGKTLLAQTRARLAHYFPPERTAFVLVKHHERFFRQQLADVGPEQLIIQPENKGTTAAILCSILRVKALAGNPVIALFPTDHYYAHEARFMNSVERAVRITQHHSDTLVLLGAQPEHAEIDYGWIEPAGNFRSPVSMTLQRVAKFWEKPTVATAHALLLRGCLWNMFVMVGRASLFSSLLANSIGSETVRADGPSHSYAEALKAQDQLWPTLVPGDFSRQVLPASTGSLAVLRVGDIGWSDLGTPERVRSMLAGSGAIESVVRTS